MQIFVYLCFCFLDLELLFDYVSTNIPESEILTLFGKLGGENKESSLYSRDPCEYFFKKLVSWTRKHPTINHRNVLIEHLKATGEHEDLVKNMESFSKDQYMYPKGEICWPEKEVSKNDLDILQNEIGLDYCHFVRFLGMKQQMLDSIQEDYHNLKNKVLMALRGIWNQQLTRQKLCNALHYSQRSDIIKKLNESWKSAYI